MRSFWVWSRILNGRAGVVVYLHVDDVNAELEKAVAIGATRLEPPQDRGDGFITATVVDPFWLPDGSGVGAVDLLDDTQPAAT